MPPGYTPLDFRENFNEFEKMQIDKDECDNNCHEIFNRTNNKIIETEQKVTQELATSHKITRQEAIQIM